MTRPYRTRKLLSVAEQNTLWAQRRCGATSAEIAQVVGAVRPTIQLWIVRYGGVAPAARHRARAALTLGEREEISRGIAADEGVRPIARRLERDPGTISREIRRHARCETRRQSATQRAFLSAAPE